MTTLETEPKEQYISPELTDITPVTLIATGGESIMDDNAGGDDPYP